MGAVTARQRESIPAGTGTTDLPRETVHEGRRRHGWRERERERQEEGGDEAEREGNLRPGGEKAGREGGEGKASSIKRGARGGGGGE